MISIPLTNPSSENKFLDKEIKLALGNVLKSGNYILSEECNLFEEEFARYLNINYAVGCNSGTDALFIALKSLDLKENDEVIIPSHSAVATCAAVKMSGAKVIFADIEKDFHTIDPKSVEEKISAKTRAVIAVHIFGQACDMVALKKICKKNGLVLIEDCAQSVGSEYKSQKLGTIGDIGCFSFFPTKNLGATGDAGCVVTQNRKLFNFFKKFRQYGWNKDRISSYPGINSRIDEMHAAILRIKLNKLDLFNEMRNEIAKRYFQGINNTNLKLPKVREHTLHSFHLFVVQSNKRNKLINYLAKNGISAGLHYKKPIHRTGGYEENAELPVTDGLYSSNVSIPMFPFLKKREQIKIIKCLNEY